MNLEFNIIPGEIKPVIRYHGVNLMFDTGAGTPVWSYGEASFKSKFPDAVKKDYKFILSGFGRSQEELLKFLSKPDAAGANKFLSDVYSIPSFSLESNGQSIEWKNLNVAITNRKAQGYHLILPSPMFGGMSLTYTQEKIFHKIVISSPVDTKYTFVKMSNRFNGEVLDYIYTQDDVNYCHALI